MCLKEKIELFFSDRKRAILFWILYYGVFYVTNIKKFKKFNINKENAIPLWGIYCKASAIFFGLYINFWKYNDFVVIPNWMRNTSALSFLIWEIFNVFHINNKTIFSWKLHLFGMIICLYKAIFVKNEYMITGKRFIIGEIGSQIFVLKFIKNVNANKNVVWCILVSYVLTRLYIISTVLKQIKYIMDKDNGCDFSNVFDISTISAFMILNLYFLHKAILDNIANK